MESPIIVSRRVDSTEDAVDSNLARSPKQAGNPRLRPHDIAYLRPPAVREPETRPLEPNTEAPSTT